MLCPNCAYACEEGAHFCSACGAMLPLPETEDIPAPAQEAPVTGDTAPAHEEPEISDMPEDADIAEELILPDTSYVPQSVYTPFTPARKGALWPPLVIMAVLLCIGLVLFYLIPGDAFDPGTHSDTPWFTVEDGVLYFDEHKYTGSEELTVPETVGGQTVLALSDRCFAYCDMLTTVYLPDTLTFIGQEAFYDCENLRGVRIPDQVSSIGKMAFFSCEELEAVCIPASVQYMGSDIFDGCGDLRYILYAGGIDQWRALYHEIINAEVVIYAADGTYAHAGR